MKRAHIEYVLRKLGAERFTYSSDWVMTNCVLAKWTHEKGRDSNPSFGVRESSGISGAHCFSCKFSGGLISLIRTYGRYAIEEGTATKEEIDELVDYVLLAERIPGLPGEACSWINLRRFRRKIETC